MKVTACDRCRSIDKVKTAVMTAEGIHEPQPISRGERIMQHGGIDLCESCLVSLAHHWSTKAESSFDNIEAIEPGQVRA